MNLSNKKGAIELSMTTIIVIVIGVTLLILGLTWVRGTFEKVTSISEKSFTSAEKLIQEQMASDAKFYISGFTFEIEGGTSREVYTGIQNFGEIGTSNKFSISVDIGPQGGDSSWFILPGALPIDVGDRKGVPFQIKVPRGLEPGSSYTFTVNILKDGQPYDSQPIIVKVK